MRWCEGLVGGKIWLWISGASGGHDKDAAGDAADGRDDAEAEAEAEAEAANPEPAEPAEPAEPVSASASISKHAFGRWAVASVESYNPVTGRHACLVEGGAGPDPAPPGTPPAKIRVALLERRYRVISRREDASGAQLGVGRPARGKKRARDGRVDDASAKPAKKGATRSATETEAAETFRVVVFPPPHGWDVDHFLQRRADEMWDIIEEQAVKVLGPATGAENAGGGGGEGARAAGARAVNPGPGSAPDAAATGRPARRARRRLDLDAADESDEDDRSDSGDDVDSDDDEDAGALGRRGDLGWTSYADFEEEMIEALENDAPVTIVRNASRAVCDAVTAAVDARGEAEDDPPDERLHAATRPARVGGAARRSNRDRPALGARVTVRTSAIAADHTSEAERKGKGKAIETASDGKKAWLPATVVRHGRSDAVDVELDDGRFLDDVKRDDVRDGEEEEEKADANDAPGGDSATRDERTPGLALGLGDGRVELHVAPGSSRAETETAVEAMLARVGGGGGGGGIGIGGGPEGLLDALMRRVVGDGAARIIVRRAGADDGVFAVSARGGGDVGGGSGGGGLTRSWSGLDISESGRDGSMIMRRDISLDQLREEPDETRPTSPPPRSASRGPTRPPSRLGPASPANAGAGAGAGAASSAIGKPQPASTSARIPRTPRTVPSPETCERPPKVRVRYALATPDDSGASLSATFAGAAARSATAASSPFASGASSTGSAAAKSRAVAAASAPATPFVAHHGGSTVFHAIRALAARASLAAAAAAAEADARAGFEDDAARRSAGRVSADHDRWLSRCVVHYDVRVEGLPADVATAPGELAALTPAAPEARGDVTRVGGGVRRGRERGLEKATAKSAKPVVAPWSPDEVRARLIDGVAPKLTKQTVVNAMRRAFDVDALASAGLEGNAATMAKRASAAKLCDAYAALVAAAESGARKTETNPNPNPNEEDAARGGPNPNEEDAARGGPNPNEEDAARLVPPPPAPNDVPSDSAWGLYWRALACGIGGGAATTAPPRGARTRRRRRRLLRRRLRRRARTPSSCGSRARRRIARRRIARRRVGFRGCGDGASRVAASPRVVVGVVVGVGKRATDA